MADKFEKTRLDRMLSDNEITQQEYADMLVKINKGLSVKDIMAKQKTDAMASRKIADAKKAMSEKDLVTAVSENGDPSSIRAINDTVNKVVDAVSGYSKYLAEEQNRNPFQSDEEIKARWEARKKKTPKHTENTPRPKKVSPFDPTALNG